MREPCAQGGRDTFVFAGSSGKSNIFDFRQSEDVLEFAATLSDLSIEIDRQGRTVVTVAGSTSQGTVTLYGFTGTLGLGDFVLVAWPIIPTTPK